MTALLDAGASRLLAAPPRSIPNLLCLSAIPWRPRGFQLGDQRATRLFLARNRVKTPLASNSSPRSACSIPCRISRLNASRRISQTSSDSLSHAINSERSSAVSLAAAALISSSVLIAVAYQSSRGLQTGSSHRPAYKSLRQKEQTPPQCFAAQFAANYFKTNHHYEHQ